MNTIFYKGYVIDIYETKNDYQYVIKKDEKIISQSAQGYTFPDDAEVNAKMQVDRIIGKQNGWMIT